MSLVLPVAGVVVNPWLILSIGLFAGFCSGLLGVGGGFIMTPLLITMGIDPVIAAASGTNAIVGASTTGTVTHLRSGNIDMKLGVLLLSGGILGGGAGTFLIKVLRARGNAVDLIIFSYIFLLAVMGSMMFVDGLSSRVREERETQSESFLFRLLRRIPGKTTFRVSGIEISPLVPFLLGTLVGILAAVMGVGGGFFLVPAMTFALAIPMRVVVGTNLFQMVFATASVTIMQALMNHSVDAVLGLTLIVGAALGARVGAAFSRVLKGDQLKLLFALLVLALSIKMANDLLRIPINLLGSSGTPR